MSELKKPSAFLPVWISVQSCYAVTRRLVCTGAVFELHAGILYVRIQYVFRGSPSWAAAIIFCTKASTIITAFLNFDESVYIARYVGVPSEESFS